VGEVDRFSTSARASAVAMPNQREITLAARNAPSSAIGHALAAEIEHVIDQWSSPDSARLQALFAAADNVPAQPPPAMASYLERKFEARDGEGNRRRAKRALLLATVTAIPLDRDSEACGDAFKAVARDVSAGGLSLLHTRAVTAKRLALRWQRLSSPRRTITVVLRVIRCQPLGPFYLVAGQFEKSE
jgi:hypothetical protein